MNCIFCRIAQGKLPASIIYQDEFLIVINDKSPQAPKHKLVFPRKHIATLNDLDERDDKLVCDMMKMEIKIAKNSNMADKGYRLVMNCNDEGDQTIYHIHIHLLGGRNMTWPPG